jgi:hypothetical protein
LIAECLTLNAEQSATLARHTTEEEKARAEALIKDPRSGVRPG